MNKQRILKLAFAVWIVLWVFFLAREDKDGQYRSLAYNYTHGYADKVRYLMGADLYDFLVFVAGNMPEDATYELAGFEKFSIDEVRARYFLWPLKSSAGGADFRVVYGGGEPPGPGYAEYKKGPGGRLLKKEGGGL